MNHVVLTQLLAIALVVAVVALAVVTIPVHRGPQPLDAAHTDPRGWRGFVYMNPDDPRMFVPNRLGAGRTLNFGHPRARYMLMLLAGLTALCVSVGTLLADSH